MSTNLDGRVFGTLGGDITGGRGGMESGSGSGLKIRDDSLEESTWIKVMPVNSNVETASEIRFEFVVPDTSVAFAGEAYFEIDCRLTRLDSGAPLTSEAVDGACYVAPDVLPFDTMFPECRVVVNGVDFGDQVPGYSGNYASFVRAALGDKPAMGQHGWSSGSGMWSLEGAIDQSGGIAGDPLEQMLAANSRCTELAGEVTVAATDVADMAVADNKVAAAVLAAEFTKLLKLNQVAEILAATVNEGKRVPAALRRAAFTRQNTTTTGAQFVTLGFRPKTSIFSASGCFLPGGTRVSITLLRNPVRSAPLLFNGKAIAVGDLASGTSPAIAIAPNGIRLVVKQAVLTPLANELLQNQLSGAIDGIPKHVSIATMYARTQQVNVPDTMKAGVSQSVRLFPGRATDIIAVQFIPSDILQKKDPEDNGRFSVFRGQYATDWVSNSSGGVGSIQCVVGSKSFPQSPCTTHEEAYANYCACAADCGYLVHGNPPLTKEAWLLHPIYCFNLRRNGTHPSEFMTDSSASEVTLLYALHADADEYTGGGADAENETGGLVLVASSFAWNELRVGLGGATSVVGRVSG